MSEPVEITFHSGPPRIGQVTLFTSEEETRLLFTGTRVNDGARVRSVSTSRSRRVRREEIIAARGKVAQRVRVAFIEDVTTTDTDGKKGRSVGPFAGSTFEIERKDDHADLSVYDTSGAPVRLGIAAQIAGLYRDFGREGAPPVKLPAGPQRIGQSAPELAESMAAGIAAGASLSKVESPQATLAEIRPGQNGALHGLYRVSLKVSGESSGSLVALDLTGTILLRDVDSVPLEVRLQGPLRSTPPDPAAGAPPGTIPGAAGEFKMTQTMVYARA